jgi:hypothetical protein
MPGEMDSAAHSRCESVRWPQSRIGQSQSVGMPKLR